MRPLRAENYVIGDIWRFPAVKHVDALLAASVAKRMTHSLVSAVVCGVGMIFSNLNNLLPGFTGSSLDTSSEPRRLIADTAVEGMDNPCPIRVTVMFSCVLGHSHDMVEPAAVHDS